MLDPTTGTTSDLRPDRETFSWIDAQGVPQQNTDHYAYLDEISTPVDLGDRDRLLRAASTSLNSKVSLATPTLRDHSASAQPRSAPK